MKPDIHPKYAEATVTCACGHTWKTRSTRPNLRTDLCSQCHPFYTGEQRIVDTAGQVDRFMRRLNRRQELAAARKPSSTAPVAQPAEERPTVAVAAESLPAREPVTAAVEGSNEGSLPDSAPLGEGMERQLAPGQAPST
jgi:large subunit ribosomal protein L31